MTYLIWVFALEFLHNNNKQFINATIFFEGPKVRIDLTNDRIFEGGGRGDDRRAYIFKILSFPAEEHFWPSGDQSTV